MDFLPRQTHYGIVISHFRSHIDLSVASIYISLHKFCPRQAHKGSRVNQTCGRKPDQLTVSKALGGNARSPTKSSTRMYMRMEEYSVHSMVAGMSTLKGVSRAGSWSGELFLIHETAPSTRRRNQLDLSVGAAFSAFSVGGS